MFAKTDDHETWDDVGSAPPPPTSQTKTRVYAPWLLRQRSGHPGHRTALYASRASSLARQMAPASI